MKPDKTYRVLIVGNSGVGKTSLVMRWVNNMFKEEYNPTDGIHVYHLSIPSSVGDIVLAVEDYPGQKGIEYIDEIDMSIYDIALVMYDTTVFGTFDSVKNWIKAIKRRKNIPIVICGNKIDSMKDDLYRSEIDLYIALGIKYSLISAKKIPICRDPLYAILETLTGDNNITIDFSPGKKKDNAKDILLKIKKLLEDIDINDE